MARTLCQRGTGSRGTRALRPQVPSIRAVFFGDLRRRAEFLPRRQWVTYVSYPEQSLWRCRVDGSDRLATTYPPVVAGIPHWSRPTQIAYIDAQPGRPWKGFLISAQGGTPQECSRNHTEADEHGPPMAREIAFGRTQQVGSSEPLASTSWTSRPARFLPSPAPQTCSVHTCRRTASMRLPSRPTP